VKNQRIQVNGLHMGVTVHGEALARQQTLVLLHGFTGRAANWVSLFPRLEAPGRWLIALDMLGHGRSDAPTDPARYAIAHCQTDILAILRTLGIRAGEAVLLGYSMGGRIALSIAFSGFFCGLILESASPGLSDPAEREQRRQSDNQLGERIEREGVEAFINYWEQLPLFASQQNLSLETREALRAQRLNNRALGLANSLRGVGTGAQPALHERLHTLDLPVLLLAGERDVKFCQIAQQMARQLPHAQLQIVRDAGHAIHLEQPDIFTSLIQQSCSTIFHTGG
jgi:2-succinyl-6-hydroxy-2,4-cyclohexadiene-1-carboxylate synthase